MNIARKCPRCGMTVAPTGGIYYCPNDGQVLANSFVRIESTGASPNIDDPSIRNTMDGRPISIDKRKWYE